MRLLSYHVILQDNQFYYHPNISIKHLIIATNKSNEHLFYDDKVMSRAIVKIVFDWTQSLNISKKIRKMIYQDEFKDAASF